MTDKLRVSLGPTCYLIFIQYCILSALLHEYYKLPLSSKFCNNKIKKRGIQVESAAKRHAVKQKLLIGLKSTWWEGKFLLLPLINQ